MKWCCLCILFNSCCSCRSVANSSCFCFLVNSCWLCMSVNLFCVRYSELMLFMRISYRWTCVCALQWTLVVHAFQWNCVFVFVFAELVVCAAWWTLGLLFVTVQFSELSVGVRCAGPWPVWCVCHKLYTPRARVIAACSRSLHQTTRYPCMYRDLFRLFCLLPFRHTLLLIIIIAIISVALYLTDKGEHTVLYKINNNGYIKTWKIINYIVI